MILSKVNASLRLEYRESVVESEGSKDIQGESEGEVAVWRTHELPDFTLLFGTLNGSP